jgi:hypothetical protein
MLRAMQSQRPQPPTTKPVPRRKRVVTAAVQRPDAERRHAFRIPDVREIPRRAVAGPWEAGW